MKALSLVLVVTLVAAPALGAVGPAAVSPPAADLGGSPTAQAQSPPNGTVHVLDIPPQMAVRSTLETQHVDLGPALGFAGVRASGQIQSLASVERIEATEAGSSRQQLILGEINRIEQKVIALRSEQQRAVESYNAGETTARELLIQLARIDAEARDLDDRQDRLREIAQETPDFSVSSGRFAALERELDTFTGPVRGHAAAVLSGREPPVRFFVKTSENGIVLSVVVDDTYVREAYRSDLRDRSAGGVTPTEALDVVAESYPTVWGSRATQSGADVVGAGDSYLVRISHGRGTLNAYVDAGSAKVFKESQTRPLESVEAGQAATEVKDGLRLSVNRTYPGGPLRIQLNESSTGDPVDANVTIGLEASRESALLGRTGADGTLWTVSPASRYTITVIKGNAAVVLTASPTPIPELATNQTTQTDNNTTTPTPGPQTPPGNDLAPPTVG